MTDSLRPCADVGACFNADVPTLGSQAYLDLMYKLSHDLRTTFGVISGLISLLELPADAIEKNDVLRRLQNNTDYAARLFEDVEDYFALHALDPRRVTNNFFAAGDLFLAVQRKLAPLLNRYGATCSLENDYNLLVTGNERIIARLTNHILFYLMHHFRGRHFTVRWADGDQGWSFVISCEQSSVDQPVYLPETTEHSFVSFPIGFVVAAEIVSLLNGTMAWRKDDESRCELYVDFQIDT